MAHARLAITLLCSSKEAETHTFVHSKSVVHRFVTGFIAAAVFVQEIFGHTSRRGL